MFDDLENLCQRQCIQYNGSSTTNPLFAAIQKDREMHAEHYFALPHRVLSEE